MSRKTNSTGVALVALLLGMLAIGTTSALGHVTERSGPFEVELGWGEEPPQVGHENFVEVLVSDARGAPVSVPPGALSVEVVYGSAALTLPLVPTAAKGSLEAKLTPTRPGTYTFHVSGTVRGQSLDASATCSEATFECVEATAGTEFPVEDPSAGELGQRLISESARLAEANDSADSARTLAIVALALAAVALAASVRAVRGRRGSSRS
ncbi:MAG TPA: hypothetical protein VFI03_06635 [Solirubrobacterales bacterium]|nr:hypothetical protein [Solirubrobacterales bacterium]